MRPNHIYHVFPLGALRETEDGRDSKANTNRAKYRNICQLTALIPHLQSLRADSILLGPVFKSETHGYDVTDMYQVDPRMGNNDDLKKMVSDFHDAGFQVFFDAVWNHSSRHHFAYRDLREKGQNSTYAGWYRNPRFNTPNLCGDSFTVDCWAGFQELPAFNLRNPEVERELIHCAEFWMDEFGIDGIRIDAAEDMDREFLRHLATACHQKRGDFWMMGEVVFGDPRRWLEAGLNSVTNYQTYKSCWSSINDKNMFELAYNLNQLFDDRGGSCKGARLQLFNENHDVSRIYSILKNKADNFVQHLLFYTMPGVPTIYYGEEFGLDAIKGGCDDWNLRPSLDEIDQGIPAGQENLLAEIRRLAAIRMDCDALREGGYQQEFVHSQQLAFWRTHQNGDALVLINLQDTPVQFEIDLRNHYARTPQMNSLKNLRDLLSNDFIEISNSKITVVIPPKWGRILVPSGT
ncbi:MAG: alpha-amylase family glycosyl hydrolase [Fibrobacter sp.]|nr:alpha-amylase family glycosyl hydrolase [Fibrobacter sp.]